MGDLLGSLVWGVKSGQYCVIGGGSLHDTSEFLSSLPCGFVFGICFYQVPPNGSDSRDLLLGSVDMKLGPFGRSG
jgi:hypothetical protein